MKQMNVQMQITGGTFLAMLTLIFITLKLTDFIDWSWWWVLAPIWIPAAITIVIVIVAILITVIRK